MIVCNHTAGSGGCVNILGINYYFHDSTACIVADGPIVAAIEEERLGRNKHTDEFPRRAIERCMAVAGLSATDIDAIAVPIKPSKHWFGVGV
jgi:carbamoyltransferase